MDLVAGVWDGSLNYIENTGTTKVPTFVQRTGSVNPFDCINASINLGWNIAPTLGDLDGDGTLRRCP